MVQSLFSVEMNCLLDNQYSERLFFRKLVAGDYDDWLSFFRDPESALYLTKFDGSPEERCYKWIKAQFDRYYDQNGLYALVDKQTGAMVGQCGLLKQQVDGINEIEIGYHVLPQYRRMGYATEAAIRCKEFAFTNNIADSVISIIHKDNTKSQRVAMKNNMVLEKETTFRETPVFVFRVNNY